MRKKGIVKKIILLMIIFIVINFIMSNYGLKVTHEKVYSSKIGNEFSGYKILQLSDLHSKEFGKDNSRLLKKIYSENPDIVVMTGDMINTTDVNYDVFYKLAQKVASKYPTYYIVGNHEQGISETVRYNLTDYLYSINVNVIDNYKIELEKGNEKINLYGMWFNLRYYKDVNDEITKNYNFDLSSMESVMGYANKEEYNILLTHNPIYKDTYSAWGADLVLSGHLHGGMIYVPFVGGLFSPEKEIFPKVYGGRYKVDNTDLVVSKGLGTGTVGFRMFNTPEIVTITLYSE